jgi:hypothetical protein
MPLIRTNADVMTMLERLQREVPNPADLDGSTGEGVYETLLWLTGDRPDNDLAVHFEE